MEMVNVSKYIYLRNKKTFILILNPINFFKALILFYKVIKIVINVIFNVTEPPKRNSSYCNCKNVTPEATRNNYSCI